MVRKMEEMREDEGAMGNGERRWSEGMREVGEWERGKRGREGREGRGVYLLIECI